MKYSLYTREFHQVHLDLLCASDQLDRAMDAAADVMCRIEHPEWWADWFGGARDLDQAEPMIAHGAGPSAPRRAPRRYTKGKY